MNLQSISTHVLLVLTPLGAMPEEIRALENAVMRPSQEAVVEQLEDGRIRLEKLTVDPKAGSLTIPCKVNMGKGMVEYALVTEYGKCHESILKTESAPHNIQAALLLLGAKSRPVGQPRAKVETGADPARLTARVEWDLNGGNVESRPLGDCYVFGNRGEPSTGRAGGNELHFNGSKVVPAGFLANQEGSVVSLVGDDLAVLNEASPTAPAEEPYIREGVLPREGRSVRLVLSRFPVEAATSAAAPIPAKEGSP